MIAPRFPITSSQRQSNNTTKSPLRPYFDQYRAVKNQFIIITYITCAHFFLDLDLLFEAGAGLEAFDMTLEAREEGAAEPALLPAADLTLSRALFCR